MISNEEIEKFLQGYDDEQYIVAVEYDYVKDCIWKIIEHPIHGKQVKKDTFIPFAWVGDLKNTNFYTQNNNNILFFIYLNLFYMNNINISL